MQTTQTIFAEWRVLNMNTLCCMCNMKSIMVHSDQTLSWARYVNKIKLQRSSVNLTKMLHYIIKRILPFTIYSPKCKQEFYNTYDCFRVFIQGAWKLSHNWIRKSPDLLICSVGCFVDQLRAGSDMDFGYFSEQFPVAPMLNYALHFHS